MTGSYRRIAAALLAVAAALAGTATAATPDTPFVGRLDQYTTTYEDTLHDVARRFDLGFTELRAANPDVDPFTPGEGTRLLLPGAHLLPDAPRRGIVVNLAEMRLFYFAEDGIETFPLGIGREGVTTPLGATSIVRKQESPAWYPPESIRARQPELPGMVPPGPDNPLGDHALYLGWPAYLIHGTNKPYGVGRRVSSGCLRMYPEDIRHLYETVPVGTPVTVVSQPIKFAWVDGELYMEAHPDPEVADEVMESGDAPAQWPEQVLERAHEVAGDQADRLDFPTLLQAAIERRGYPIRVTK